MEIDHGALVVILIEFVRHNFHMNEQPHKCVRVWNIHGRHSSPSSFVP